MINDQVISYIKSELQRGKNIDEIKDALASQGWENTFIGQSIEAVRTQPEFSTFFSTDQAPLHVSKSPAPLRLTISALLVVIALGAGGIYTYKRHTQDMSSANPSSSSPSPSNATAQWNTFKSTNSANKDLSFEYPADYTVSEFSEGDIQIRQPNGHTVVDLYINKLSASQGSEPMETILKELGRPNYKLTEVAPINGATAYSYTNHELQKIEDDTVQPFDTSGYLIISGNDWYDIRNYSVPEQKYHTFLDIDTDKATLVVNRMASSIKF